MSGVRDAGFDLGSLSYSASRGWGYIEDFDQLGDFHPNYAERPRRPSSQNPRSVRSLLLSQTILRPAAGDESTGQQRSMRGRDKLGDIRDGERRLTSKYGNKNETPIIPGETIFRKKKPAQQFSPKPVDAISGSRQSGPVRAQGKQKQAAGQETYKLLDLESQNIPDLERPERPSKRRRRNPQETASNLSDDEVMTQSAPVSETPPLGKRKRIPDTNRHVNKMGDHQNGIRANENSKRELDKQRHVSSDDERFTEHAAKERRDMSSDSEELSQTPKPAVLHSVQVLVPRVHPKTSTSRSLQSQIMSTDSNFDPRAESPDELQGEATTQPVPAALPAGRKKKASNGSNPSAEKAACQRSSPTDIRSTEFSPTTPQGNRVRKKARKKAQIFWSFEALLVQDGNVQLRNSDDKSPAVHFDKSKGILRFVGGDTADSPHEFSVPLKRVVQIIQGHDPSSKLRLNLSKMESPVGSIGPIDIELSSTEEKNTLCDLFRDVSVQSKDSKWMDNAFKKSQRDISLHANKYKRLTSEGVPEPAPEPKTETVKRQKVSASLEAGDESTEPSNDADKDPSKTPFPAEDSNEPADHDAHGHPSRESVSTTVEIPVKKCTPDAPSHGRDTRSSRRSLPATHDLCDDDDDEDPNPQPPPGGESERWGKPLVYPRFGKKKAEVDAQDLERLRDNEFLNDNLIGFYIRFLEDHLDRTNKEAAKKVYFFNTYFYATLTNKRPINYESVQKWTRNVDIFSHDYVVVPINEAAHWYVAIICNLPNLQNDTKEETGPDEAPPEDKQQEPPSQTEGETQAIPETPEPNQEAAQDPEEKEGDQKPDGEPAKEEITRQSMAAMTLGDKEVPASADEEWPEKEENPTTSSARFSSPPKTRAAQQQKGQKNTPGSKTTPRKPKKQKKKPRDHLDPRDPREPVIITFDSLDFPRALTTRNLRQYLAAEAKSKKGTDIDTSRMAGIRARAIPFQNNSSDCGLYMLAYLEKFVQDPDVFVSRLLQGQMTVGADWPPLSSGPLRLRLRQFLDDLYDEQAQLGTDKASEKPPMADKKPICFLLPEQKRDPEQNTNTNPEGAETQEKPSSPQSATAETSEPFASAAPPPPPTSEAVKSPEVEAQLSTAAGPLQTPDSPARNLRQRRSNNTGLPKAVRSAAALFGRFNQRTESGADRDIVVEVPDSQEHDLPHDPPHAHPIITDLSSPTKMKNPDEPVHVHTPISASKLDKRKRGDVVTVDDDDPTVPASASESGPAIEVVGHGSPRVEVQVKETPPPEMRSTKEKD